MRRLIILGMLATLLLAGPGAGQENSSAPNAWYEGFEGPEPSWRVVGGNAQYRVEFHGRVLGEAHSGQRCERIRIAGSGGTEVFIGHAVGRPRIIDELLPTVWVKSDRQGIQMGVQVVLPRSTDPRTRRPLATVLYGSSYTTVGRWQQLRVAELPLLLARQTRVLRAQFGPQVDPREAYVEQVLLNVYGGPGVTDVWIDDLDVAHHVGPPPEVLAAGPPVGLPTGGASGASLPEAAPMGAATPSEPGRGPSLSGSLLRIDDREMFPRIIEYQGEPLSFLRQLGFNTVALAQVPSAELLEEAGRLGLWIICPPPFSPRPEGSGQGEGPPSEIGPLFDRVLAWDLGSGLGVKHLAATAAWARQVKAADRRCPGRPIVCRPTSQLRAYSRAVDIPVLGRGALATGLDLSDYALWLRQRPSLMIPGAPFWTTIETQPAEFLRRQWSAVGQTPPSAAFSPESLRLLVYTAITCGSRGLWFQSTSPLDAGDADTRLRALTLELLNLEAVLMEPWAAAGSVLATVAGTEPALVATLLQTNHARLLVPIWLPPGSQCVAGQAAAHDLSFLVPGVPETNKAYWMLPGELRPFHPPRKAGGVRVAVEEFDLTALVMLTQHPTVVAAMGRRAAQIGRRAVEIQRQLAAWQLRRDAELAKLLAVPNPGVRYAAYLAEAQKHLLECDRHMGVGNLSAASLAASRARRPLRLLEREHWEAAVRPLHSPVASPPAVTFATLPWHWRLMEQVAASRPGPSLLPAADFEDLAAVFTSGWQHFQHPNPALQIEAELTPAAAHSGNLGLRLAVASGKKDEPAAMESPPVWITSPAVPVPAGQLLRIRGWVNVPQPIRGSVDGLLVLDSLGGEPLAHRIRRTEGWQQFVLYRMATHTGTMSLTFALAGLGEAFLDDVEIEPLSPAVPLGNSAPVVPLGSTGPAAPSLQ